MKLVVHILSFIFILLSCNYKKGDYKSFKNQNVTFSKNFTISKKGDKTIVTIINPDNNSIDKNFYISKKDPNFIWFGNKKYNSKSIICLSSTFIGFLDKLNELSSIVGVDKKELINNRLIIKKIENHQIKELGSTETVSVKKMLSTTSQIVLYSGFGNKFPNEDKLNKLQILCLPVYDWKETHPLGKAEWIKFFGVITNKEKEAFTYFKKLKNRYFHLKNKYKNIAFSEKLFSGSMIGDFWYSPAGNSYIANLFKDARINYAEKNSTGTGSINNSFEYSLKKYQNAKYWLNPGVKSNELLARQNKKYTLFHAFPKNTYCYSHNSNLYWEKSAIEPDSLLMDLIQITHPELKLNRNLYFYKKLK